MPKRRTYPNFSQIDREPIPISLKKEVEIISKFYMLATYPFAIFAVAECLYMIDAHYTQLYAPVLSTIGIATFLLIFSCCVGQNTTDESAKLSNVFYGCSWYYLSKPNKNILLIILSYTIRPVYHEWMGISRLGFALLVTGLRTVYSLLAVAKAVLQN